VPLGPVKPYADAPTEEPLELRVYPGRDGHFTLYDDSGDGYGYLSGQKSTIDLQWLERKRVLRIGSRRGTYPGMPASLSIGVTCAGKPDFAVGPIRYDGRAGGVCLRSCIAHLAAASGRWSSS
jgi:alpha-D-xyloside xylohydrolase